MSIKENLQQIVSTLPQGVTLVAVTKTHAVSRLEELYAAGHRIFGENKVQELIDKQATLPKDILWHLIGHLQSNKVKFIAPFISLIHSVDSKSLLQEINKQALKAGRVISCLLQIHIAEEETKFGFDFQEAERVLRSQELVSMTGVNVIGLMGMATNTEDAKQVAEEFASLQVFYNKMALEFPALTILSMGMSSDYPVAIENGSNMVRIGSSIFGSR
ncbi:MAG: YggS family pyridoxal phosphate-dependent enzyme [Bacteroidota bacterium]|nr:YggS family pyridoxal phosphate-dependent enzyme [Bacteroidota bacterium]